MKTLKNYTFTFESSKPVKQIFKTLLDVRQWWSGLYGEQIEGKSERVNDVFTFDAGNGAHHSVQQLVRLIPDKTIEWQVTDSNLAFLAKADEWNNSKISFELSVKGDKTQITFTHAGLGPHLECYDSCSDAWTLYLKNLRKQLK